MNSSYSSEEKNDPVRSLRHAIKNDVSVIIAFTQLVKVNPADERSEEFLNKIEARARLILSNIEKYIESNDQKKN